MSIPRRSVKAKVLPTKSTNGAISQAAPVAEVVCPGAARPRPETIARQTHGAVTANGPITTVAQLINGGRNIAKGAVGSFASLEDYTEYLRSLDTHALHRHSVNEARLVPIDDRERLIRRLETAWTTTASRHPARVAAIPARKPFTEAQLSAQEAVRHQVLGR